jgi:anti-sigma-K factor RskA
MCGSKCGVKQTEKDDNLLARYLLGLTSSEDQAEVEGRYFRDADFHRLVLAVEQELICDYVRGHLPPAARARFESHYLATPARRRKYEQTRTLLAGLAAVASDVAAGSEVDADASAEAGRETGADDRPVGA